ncbi:MAG: hypothetical protein WCP20_11075 [Desulfuromonadales bacterium]
MLDFNSRSALTDRLNYLIDNAISATAAESQSRNYLGASVIGHVCERHVQFHYMAAMGEVTRPMPAPRILRIFDRGNMYEERVRQWLKQAGFLFGRTSKGKSFSDFDGQFSGHVDGVITGWKQQGVVCPVELPALWENKCLGSKGWKKLEDDKLKKYSSTYFAQVQIYMYYLGLERCLFTAINADTMDIYHELVPYDVFECELYRARVQAIMTGQAMQKISNDPSYYICKMCDFIGACHA